MKKLIIKNLTSNYLLSFFGMAMGFFLVPFLIGKLGKEMFGIIVLAETITGFFEIVTVSVRVALSRYVTFSLSQSKMEEFAEYLSTGRVLLFVSGFIVLVVGSGLSYYFPHIFNVPVDDHFQSRVLFFLITLAVALSIPNATRWAVIYAKQRFDLINFSMSIGLVVRAVALFAYYSWAPKEYDTLPAYGAIYLAMTLTQNVMIYFIQKRIMPGVSFSLRYFRWSKIRDILSFTGHTSISRASSLLYEETANIIINVFWGPVYNTIYSIGLKIPSLMGRIFIYPSWSLTSTFTDYVAKGDRQRFETLFFMYSKMLAIATFPICLALTFYARPLILAWVGPGFSMSADILALVSLQQFIFIPFSMTGCVFHAYGKVKLPSYASLAMGVLNVILSLVLGVVFHMKLYGIVLANVVAAMICGQLYYPTYACRLAGLSLRRYWTDAFLKPLAVCLATVGGGILLLKIVEGEPVLSLLMFVVMGLASGIHYLVSFFILLTGEERGHALDVLRMTARKFGGAYAAVTGKGNEA